MTNKKRLLVALIIVLLSPALVASHESYGYIPVGWLLISTVSALIQIGGNIGLQDAKLLLLFNIAIPLIYFGIAWLVLYGAEKLSKLLRR